MREGDRGFPGILLWKVCEQGVNGGLGRAGCSGFTRLGKGPRRDSRNAREDPSERGQTRAVLDPDKAQVFGWIAA